MNAWLPQHRPAASQPKFTENWSKKGQSTVAKQVGSIKTIPKSIYIGGIPLVTAIKRLPIENSSVESAVTATNNESISLSEAQKKVLDVIVQKKSVFFTGAAGRFILD